MPLIYGSPARGLRERLTEETIAATRLRLFLSALALSMTLLAAPAEAGSGFLKSLWGPIRFVPGEAGCPGPKRCSAFPFYRELGVDVFQFQFEWNEIAPTRPAKPRDNNDPAYRWSTEFQSAVDEAAASNIQLAAMIRGSPAWANRGQTPNWAPSARDYADFAYAAARRYPTIDLWMVWGEPNRAPNFMPQGRRGARSYGRILEAAYGELKRAGPENIVIGGMTHNQGDTLPPVWIKNLRLKDGSRPRMDWYGHNPFDNRPPNLSDRPIGGLRGLNDLDTLWRELTRAYRQRTRGGALKPVQQAHPRKLWLSEFTVQSGGPSAALQFSVSPEEQANRVRQSFALASGLSYVRGLGWFGLIDYPLAPNSPTWGLMTYLGVLKPAFEAFKALP
jgi:hypothetical protein